MRRVKQGTSAAAASVAGMGAGGRSESGSTPGGSTPPAGAMQERVELYRVAYEEAKRALDDQARELSDIRQRAVSFVAFIGSATAFLVGTRFDGSSKGAGFLSVAIPATALAFGMIASCVLLLAPQFVQWSYRVSPDRVIFQLIDRDLKREVPVPTEGELLRKLALNYEPKREENERALKRVRSAYVTCVASGAIQLVMWTFLVWHR